MSKKKWAVFEDGWVTPYVDEMEGNNKIRVVESDEPPSDLGQFLAPPPDEPEAEPAQEPSSEPAPAPAPAASKKKSA